VAVTSEMLLLAVGAALGGFVQGVSGFGFAMVAMSVWTWGIDPRLAAVMAVFGGFSGQLFATVTVRRGLHLRILAPLLAGAALGVPVGTVIVPHLDPTHFRLIVGAVLALFAPAMILAPKAPRFGAGGRAGDFVAGAAGGAMGALGGFTGLVPAIWCTLRGYGKDEQRAVIQHFNLVALGATLVALGLSGAVDRGLWPRVAVVVPALFVPSFLGSRLYLGLGAATFRTVVLTLLGVSGVLMMGAALRALL